MAENEYLVSHPRARAPLTITGKTLEEALEKEGLDPAIWHEIEPLSSDEVVPPGDPLAPGVPD